MLILRDYQERAVKNLMFRFDNLLRTTENEICVLQAPTGSGKTIICAEFLKRFVKERKDVGKFSYIWISVRQLHDQSKDKLDSYYESDQVLQCSYFEDLIDKKIDENEILFINWDSINKKDINVLVRENEQDNNLNAILKNTKDEGRQIILIIDESHHTASSARSKELIEIISPKITLEISATPQLKSETSELERVTLDDVKAEQMIKEEITINPEFSNIKISSKSATELVIEQALKKRNELKKAYDKEKANVNPLVLIQLPDKKEKQEHKKEEVIKILKEKQKITEDNGKLAIWLSEKKSENLPNIEKNDNETEVLLFKQAIALGWDCPRASILIIFRESTSVVFTIQVIGRIMRMPDPENGYYQTSDLNKGFIFTNLSNIQVAEDYAKDYVTIYESKRNNKIYKNLNLKSVYLKRQRERTRLSGEFVKIFSKISKKRKLKDKINSKPTNITNPVIVDGKIVNIDKTGEIEHKGTRDINISETEIQMRFDDFIRSNCTPFAPRDSGDRMKTALYQFFTDNFGMEKYDPEIQKIILEKENVQTIVDTINVSKDTYKSTVVEKISEEREEIIEDSWEVPMMVSYNSNSEIKKSSKSIMEPLYVKKLSEPERLFIEALDKDQFNKVKFWFKNGESEVKYFAVPYVDELGTKRAFYVDFIIYFKDGTIGIFDTKSGRTAAEAGPRSEGLQKYIKSQNKKGQKLFGGILINLNGSWLYNEKTKYKYDPNDHSDWKVLEI